MREFSPDIFNEIREEIAFIFAVHESLRLKGELRLFAPNNKEVWAANEAGFEVWCKPDTIEQAIGKLILFYRNGEVPNTPLFLDPVLYQRDPSKPTPAPIGSALLWATAYCKQGEEINPNALKRLDGLGVYYDFLHAHYPDGSVNERGGLKAIAFLKEFSRPVSEVFQPFGNPVAGTQALADMIDMHSADQTHMHYPLGGIRYQRGGGVFYQQPSFKAILPKKAIIAARDLPSYQIFYQKVLDAATCWNAYERSQIVYDRYGIDVSHLQDNLKQKRDSDSKVNSIIDELKLIWQAHKRHGLQGRMRLYTLPDQTIFRAKKEGLEIWFDDTDKSLNQAAEAIQLHYNAGVLPNSPVVLDPIVYETGEDGSHSPLGSGVAWATAFYTGQMPFSTEDLSRIKDTGCFTGTFLRAGLLNAGHKILAFLEEPYLFTEEEKKRYRDLAAKGIVKEFAVPGCKELFNLSGANGDMYAPYYLCTMLEYLCTNGAYANTDMEESFGSTDKERQKLIEKYTVPLHRIKDADACWNAYDKLHPLWRRFGIDAPHLKRNLKYYNLCGRNFDFLNMTGESRENTHDEFQFLVPGWLPKSAITIIGGTGGTGKSSIAHRLAVLTTTDWEEHEPNPKWLGSEINKSDCQGVSVYLSGEDAPSIVNARARMFDPESRSTRLMLKCGAEFGSDARGARSVGDFLEELLILPKVDVLVIDPARKYLLGDEDDSEVVSQFFEAIEMFAVEKKCAVLLVHHLVKNAHPERVDEMIDLLRGSQVFIDRARVVIGMLRDGAYTVAGLAKNNIPPKLGMVEGERVFVRDPEKLDLIWLPGEQGVRSYNVTEEELIQIKRDLEKQEQSHQEQSGEEERPVAAFSNRRANGHAGSSAEADEGDDADVPRSPKTGSATA